MENCRTIVCVCVCVCFCGAMFVCIFSQQSIVHIASGPKYIPYIFIQKFVSPYNNTNHTGSMLLSYESFRMLISNTFLLPSHRLEWMDVVSMDWCLKLNKDCRPPSTIPIQFQLHRGTNQLPKLKYLSNRPSEISKSQLLAKFKYWLFFKFSFFFKF